MTFPRRAAPALIFLVLAAGCGAKKTIVGKWQGNLPAPNGQITDTKMEFKPDGTQILTAKVGPADAVIEGRYTVKNDQMQITPSTLSYNGRSFPMPARAKVVQTYTYKIDGDKLLLTNPRTSMSLTRMKE